MWHTYLALGIWVIIVFTFVPLILKRIRKVTQKTRTEFDDILLDAVSIPIILALIAIGLKFWLNAVTLPEKIVSYIKVVIALVFAFSGILFIDKLLSIWITRHSQIDFLKTSGNIIKALFRAAIATIAMLIILNSLGVSITPLLTSLGIAGLAIALGLQDTLSNLFSGVYLLADRPFKVGDYIELETKENGYVTKIGWRSTRIRTLPGNEIILPNAKLANSKIINYYYPQKELAVLVQVGVSYDSDLEHVEKVTIEVAKEVLKEVSGGVPEFEPFIRYHTFGDFSINFTVILRAKEFVDRYLITHEFVKRLHKRYNKEGIVIPFPIRTVEIKK